MKAGMKHREDEGRLLLEQLRQRVKQRSDLGHVHQGHRADGLREAVGSKRSQVLEACGVERAVVDRRIGRCAFAGAGDELAAGVDGHDRRTERRHAARESTCATGDIENRVASRDVQQALGGWLYEKSLKVVAVADAIVPPARIGVPDPAVLVGMLRKVSV
jgi:hypothetical protein